MKGLGRIISESVPYNLPNVTHYVSHYAMLGKNEQNMKVTIVYDIV